MLDMSAAFDTVDYDSLPKRLDILFGISWASLSMILYFIRHRALLTVRCPKRRSFTSGVHQDRSCFCSRRLTSQVSEMHGINFHSYIDDFELYLHSKADEIALTFPRVASCIDTIHRWLSTNRLKLNIKRHFIVLGSKLQPAKVKCNSIHIRGWDIPFLPKVTCLGVILDSERGITSHYFYSSTNWDRLAPFVKTDHLDFIDNLHWLSAESRVYFKQCTLVYKSPWDLLL